MRRALPLRRSPPRRPPAQARKDLLRLRPLAEAAESRRLARPAPRRGRPLPPVAPRCRRDAPAPPVLSAAPPLRRMTVRAARGKRDFRRSRRRSGSRPDRRVARADRVRLQTAAPRAGYGSASQLAPRARELSRLGRARGAAGMRLRSGPARPAGGGGGRVATRTSRSPPSACRRGRERAACSRRGARAEGAPLDGSGSARASPVRSRRRPALIRGKTCVSSASTSRPSGSRTVGASPRTYSSSASATTQNGTSRSSSDAVPLNARWPRDVGAPDQLSQQARFPDARFADEGHGSAPPVVELLE